MTATLTTEQILTHPKAFGLTTATPCQRAVCRILDGQPLGELACNANVVEMVGDVTKLPVGEPPAEAHILAAVRVAKSMIAAAHIACASQTVDVSGCSGGDVLRISVVSLKVENTRAVMGHLLQNVLTKPILRALLVGKPEEATEGYIRLRHPSGRAIEIVPVPLDRAGGSITSFWSAGVVVDEEPRMIGAEDGTKNWDHARDAAMGRLLPGAQFIGIGSPWAPFGPIYDLVTERFGRPSRDLVIMRARGPQMNPVWWTPARCADLRRRNPTAYRTDVLCEFAEAEESLISGAELDATTRSGLLVLPRTPGSRYFGAMDPATRGNAWALAIVEVTQHGEMRVVLVLQWIGSSSEPLSPMAVLSEIADVLAGYGLARVRTDQWSSDALKDLGAQVGLHIIERTIGTSPTASSVSKFEILETLHSLIASRDLELSPDPVLRRDLLSLRRRVTQNGVQIVAMRTADGRHADTASALALAVDEARHLARRRARGEDVGAPGEFDDRTYLPPVQVYAGISDGWCGALSDGGSNATLLLDSLRRGER